jgi:hypothetical protein
MWTILSIINSVVPASEACNALEIGVTFFGFLSGVLYYRFNSAWEKSGMKHRKDRAKRCV